MWQPGARAPSAANAATQSSENLKVNRQILFRILPNRLNQPTGLLKQLIGVVIHGGIADQSAGRAFARLQPVGYGWKFIGSALQLGRKLLVFGEVAQRAGTC